VQPSSDKQDLIKRVIPPLVGIVLVLTFARLGIWQLDRAQEKIALQQAFDRPPRHIQVQDDLQPEPFQAIQSRGGFLGERQILIENAILDGALGYYVITPFEFDAYGPLLLVNRGWIGRNPGETELPAVSVDPAARLIYGKSGHLPRVGIRPGEAFSDHSRWPRVGVWPTTDEIAAELGRPVLPYVLLLDSDQEGGFARRWKPQQSGPSTHYGYAFQWFAMALALFSLMVWNLRKRTLKNDN
jgi:surfeit locus 1 family protein